MSQFEDHVYAQTSENRFVLTGESFDARIHYGNGRLTVAVDGHPLIVFPIVRVNVARALKCVAEFPREANEVMAEQGVLRGHAPAHTPEDLTLALDAVRTAWKHYNE